MLRNRKRNVKKYVFKTIYIIYEHFILDNAIFFIQQVVLFVHLRLNSAGGHLGPRVKLAVRL